MVGCAERQHYAPRAISMPPLTHAADLQPPAEFTSRIDIIYIEHRYIYSETRTTDARFSTETHALRAPSEASLERAAPNQGANAPIGAHGIGLHLAA